MSENFNSHIACEGTDNDINWVCKVCKDLPNYAGMYLYQREREKNQLKNVKDTHMEEVCRMDNSIFEGKRRDNISKICSNCEVFLVRDGCLKILTEPVEVCFDRAKKLQVLNQYAEESECATFEALEEKTCGLLRWDEKEVETHRKEISLLTSTQLFDPKNEMIDNESINRVFYEICGSRFPVEDFKDYCKKERTFSEIREAVRLLFILMNALGYHRRQQSQVMLMKL